MRKLLLLILPALGALTLPTSAALAGTVTLHPSGFGEDSYSAWVPHEGLIDSPENEAQALYFQKMTATTTFAAGVAVFEGVAGMPVSELGDLGFWWRTDGHCGAGAPRFNLRLQNVPGTVFIGCQEMVPFATQSDNNGRFWQQRFFPAGLLPGGTVASLSIVFDEGNDVSQGFVYLDRIRAAGHQWNSASSNANDQTIIADPTGEAFLEALLGEDLAAALSPPS
jgi:hypothetical protein